MHRTLILLVIALMLAAPLGLCARDRDPLTSLEVDQLREAAQELGEKIAREDARQQIWALEGYLLKEKLFQAGQGPSQAR